MKKEQLKSDSSKGDIDIKTKSSHKLRNVIIIATFLIVILVGVYLVACFLNKEAVHNKVNTKYGSVSIPIANGETFELGDEYTPLDIFGKLNWKFAHQTVWYSEMNGTVNTVIQQKVSTYKQYNKGILISADLTSSSLINDANQFCYIKDKNIVMWRKARGGSSSYNGLNTQWMTGDPYKKMAIEGENGFKSINGLPAYELSVYVFEEKTILSATEVTLTDDGNYQITYELNPVNWQEEEDGNLVTKGATAYYANQMIFSGGLPETPIFDSISVTYKFDKNWQVNECIVSESYFAKYGPISAGCKSTSTTFYEYNTERAKSDAYTEYFAQYLERENDLPLPQKEINSLNCLTEGFIPMLSQSSALDITLDINGQRTDGELNIDLSKTDFNNFDINKLKASLSLGALNLWIEEGTAYCKYGGLKLKLSLDRIISLFDPETNDHNFEGNQSLDISEMLSSIVNGSFFIDDNIATLDSEIELFGAKLRLYFEFYIDENRSVKFKKASVNTITDDENIISAQLTYGNRQMQSLSASEKQEFYDIDNYADALGEMISSGYINAQIEYFASPDAKLTGNIKFDLHNMIFIGDFDISVSNGRFNMNLDLIITYINNELFIDFNGVKSKTTINEIITLIENLMGSDKNAEASLDIYRLLNLGLSQQFANYFEMSPQEDSLMINIQGTQLLKEIGIDFDIGNIIISFIEKNITITAEGFRIVVSEGEAFTVEQ